MMNTVTDRVLDQNKPPAAEQSVVHNTGRWTGEEHGRFLQGLQQHGKVWKSIATVVKTRSIVQVRTHAQKYFMKMNRGDSPTPQPKPSTTGNSPPPAKAEESEASAQEPMMCKSTSLTKSSWKSSSASMPKSKSFMSSKPGGGTVSFGTTNYPTNVLPTHPAAKPRARKYDDMGTAQSFAKSANPPKLEKAKKKPTKPKAKKLTKAKAAADAASSLSRGQPSTYDRTSGSAGYRQTLSYYGPHTAPGVSYSSSHPSLRDCHGAHTLDSASRKPYMPSKKGEARNKRARLSKAVKARQQLSYQNPLPYSSCPPGMGDSPTHMSHPLSCPDFSYYNQDGNYPFPNSTEIDDMSTALLEGARIPSCESETEDSLDLENILLKENLLLSAKKEWPNSLQDENKLVIPPEFNLMMPQKDLNIQLPGNDGFKEMETKDSPTSIMEPSSAWITYPDFVKPEKDVDLVPLVGDEAFMTSTSSNDESFWFGDDSFEDLLDTM